MTVSGPAWREIFGLSNTELGLCLGAAGGGVLIASIFAGHATERQGPLRVLTAAMSVVLLALFTVASSESFVMLFSGLIAVGLCVAVTHNAGITLLSDIFPLRFRQVMSFGSAIQFGSAVLVAPLIGYWLDYTEKISRREWGVRFPFVALAGALALCLLLIRLRFRWLSKAPRFVKSVGEEGACEAAGDREWIWVPLIGFFHGMMLVSLLGWLNPMAQDVLGVSQFLGSMLFGACALGLALGRLALAACHSRVWEDDRKVLVLSGFATSVIFGFALLSPSYRLTFFLVLVGGIACSATGPCLFSLVAGRFPGMRSRLYGYMEASVAAAAITGSSLVGLLYDLGAELRAAMALSPAAAFLLGAFALVWKIKRPFPGG